MSKLFLDSFNVQENYQSDQQKQMEVMKKCQSISETLKHVIMLEFGSHKWQPILWV